jgi:hypothetical protein
MILLPHDVMGRDDSVGPVLSALDREISKILQDKSLPTDNKLALYNQILYKHKKIIEERDKPYELEIRDLEPPVVTKSDPDEITLTTIPKK